MGRARVFCGGGGETARGAIRRPCCGGGCRDRRAASPGAAASCFGYLVLGFWLGEESLVEIALP